MKALWITILIATISMAQNQIKSLTDKSFSSTLNQHDKTVVMFWAPWCGACEEMKPFFEKTAQQAKDTHFAMLDIDKFEALSQEYKVKSIPTTILFKAGKEVDRAIGGLESREILELISPKKMAKFYQKSCQERNATACIWLANLHLDGRGVEKSDDKVEYYYTQACNLGDNDACTDIADYLYDQETQASYTRSIKYYLQACDNRDGYACNRLGYIYDEGLSTGKNDINKAYEYYKKSVALNNKWGYYNLALMYEKGQLVTKDIDKAIELYSKACDQEELDSCTSIADFYYDGEEISKDYNKAFTFYKKACEANDGYGCYSMGYMYEKGFGVKKEISLAKAMYALSCGNGYKDGCSALKELK